VVDVVEQLDAAVADVARQCFEQVRLADAGLAVDREQDTARVLDGLRDRSEFKGSSEDEGTLKPRPWRNQGISQ
jgi:hypothetical protein